MPRVLILEDEAPARERLVGLLASCSVPCLVVGAVDSLAAAENWLRENSAPDLILADIQLGDGLSLDLFRATPPPCPVIFTTAHDDYVLEAFATHGIGYLLKPIKKADLESALHKHRELGRHFANSLTALAGKFSSPIPARARQRILAQRGPTFQPVALADIAYFFSENKLTFLVTHTGEKCLVNEPLSALEEDLPAEEFFRINRNYLVQARAVRSFSPVGKGRLALQLHPRPAEEVLVSQENAADFRAWAGR